MAYLYHIKPALHIGKFYWVNDGLSLNARQEC